MKQRLGELLVMAVVSVALVVISLYSGTFAAVLCDGHGGVGQQLNPDASHPWFSIECADSDGAMVGIVRP